MAFNEMKTLYEVGIDRLALVLDDGTEKVFPEALSNGRANYILFEYLVRDLAGISKTTVSDHKGDDGARYEQKAFPDFDLYPNAPDLFRISASSTFGANNNGPKIKRFLEEGDYASALEICQATGYRKNDFYVLTNTSNFEPHVPFRYVILPTSELVANLDPSDPRLISRTWVLNQITKTVKIS